MPKFNKRIIPSELRKGPEIIPKTQVRDVFIAQGVRKTQTLFDIEGLQKAVPVILGAIQEASDKQVKEDIDSILALSQKQIEEASKDLQPFVDEGIISKTDLPRVKVGISKSLADRHGFDLAGVFQDNLLGYQQATSNGNFGENPYDVNNVGTSMQEEFDNHLQTLRDTNPDIVDTSTVQGKAYLLRLKRNFIELKGSVLKKSKQLTTENIETKQIFDFKGTFHDIITNKIEVDPLGDGLFKATDRVARNNLLVSLIDDAHAQGISDIPDHINASLQETVLELQNSGRHQEATELVIEYGELKINNISLEDGKAGAEYENILAKAMDSERINQGRAIASRRQIENEFLTSQAINEGSALRQLMKTTDPVEQSKVIQAVLGASEEEILKITNGNPEMYSVLLEEMQIQVSRNVTTQAISRQDLSAEIELVFKREGFDIALAFAESTGDSRFILQVVDLQEKANKQDEALYGAVGGGRSDSVNILINSPFKGQDFIDTSTEDSLIKQNEISEEAHTLKDEFQARIKGEPDSLKKGQLQIEYKKAVNNLTKENNKFLKDKSLEVARKQSEFLSGVRQGEDPDALLDKLEVPIEHRDIWKRAGSPLQDELKDQRQVHSASVIAEKFEGFITNKTFSTAKSDSEGKPITDPLTLREELTNPFAEQGFGEIDQNTGKLTLTPQGVKAIDDLSRVVSDEMDIWERLPETARLKTLPTSPLTGSNPYREARRIETNRVFEDKLRAFTGKGIPTLVPKSPDIDLKVGERVKQKEREGGATVFLEEELFNTPDGIHRDFVVTIGSTKNPQETLGSLVGKLWNYNAVEILAEKYTLNDGSRLVNNNTNSKFLYDRANSAGRWTVPQELFNILEMSAKESPHMRDSSAVLRLLPGLRQVSSDIINKELAMTLSNKTNRTLEEQLIVKPNNLSDIYYSENWVIPMEEFLSGKLFYTSDDGIRKELFGRAMTKRFDYRTHRMFKDIESLNAFIKDIKQKDIFQTLIGKDLDLDRFYVNQFSKL